MANIMQGENNFNRLNIPSPLYLDQGHANILYADGEGKRKWKNFWREAVKPGRKAFKNTTEKDVGVFGQALGDSTKSTRRANKNPRLKKIHSFLKNAVIVTGGVVAGAAGAKALQNKKNANTGIGGGIGSTSNSPTNDQPLTGNAGVGLKDIFESGNLSGALAGSDILSGLSNKNVEAEQLQESANEDSKKDNTNTYIFMALAVFVAVMIFKK